MIDAGNSDYHATRCRRLRRSANDPTFVGMGVPAKCGRCAIRSVDGRRREAYERIAPILLPLPPNTRTNLAVRWVGPGGAGHFVKTIITASDMPTCG